MRAAGIATAVVTLTAMAFYVVRRSDSSNLTPGAALKEPSAFQLRAAVSAVPAVVQAAFAKAAREQAFAMAERGAEWSSGCVGYQGLPRRRLGKLALGRSLCILFYECGGLTLTYHVAGVVWSSIQNDSPSFIPKRA